MRTSRAVSVIARYRASLSRTLLSTSAASLRSCPACHVCHNKRDTPERRQPSDGGGFALRHRQIHHEPAGEVCFHQLPTGPGSGCLEPNTLGSRLRPGGGQPRGFARGIEQRRCPSDLFTNLFTAVDAIAAEQLENTEQPAPFLMHAHGASRQMFRRCETELGHQSCGVVHRTRGPGGSFGSGAAPLDGAGQRYSASDAKRRQYDRYQVTQPLQIELSQALASYLIIGIGPRKNKRNQRKLAVGGEIPANRPGPATLFVNIDNGSSQLYAASGGFHFHGHRGKKFT
jgi:hypothetical protein